MALREKTMLDWPPQRKTSPKRTSVRFADSPTDDAKSNVYASKSSTAGSETTHAPDASATEET